MTTQPQPAVTVLPPLPTRRNSELFLLGFATVITTVALLIVEANQEQGLRWDLASYTVAYMALFGGAHLTIRRFAPYADPLLLPVVALLNGLGLVMIHRLDLAAGDVTSGGMRGPSANQQMLWTLVGVIAFALVVIFLRDHRVLARYGYVCGVAGLVLLAIPAVLPSSVSEQNGAKIWIELPHFSIQPAEFSKILLLIFFAAVLVSKRSVFTSAGKHVLGMDLPRPRDLAPLLAALDHLGRRDDLREGPRHLAAAVRLVPCAGLHSHRTIQLGRHRVGVVRGGKRCGVLRFRSRPAPGADVDGPLRRP